MKTDNLYIKDSSYYLGKELINISDFNRADLKMDKNSGKILLFITLIILIEINQL